MIFSAYPHSSVDYEKKRTKKARIKCFLFKSRGPVLSLSGHISCSDIHTNKTFYSIDLLHSKKIILAQFFIKYLHLFDFYLNNRFFKNGMYSDYLESI